MSSSHIRIEINGQPLDGFAKGCVLRDVEVVQALNTHWWCNAVIRQTGDKRFPIEDCLGKNLAVVAFDEQGQQNKLFFGFVLEAKLKFEASGSYLAHVQAVTSTYRLDQSLRYEYYRKKTVQQICNEVVEDDGLSVEIQNIERQGWDPERQLNYVQWGQSDLDFLNKLADDNWAWTRPIPSGLEICGKFQPGSSMKWRAENGLVEFAIRGKLGQPAFNGAMYDVRNRTVKAFSDISQEPQFFGSSSKMVAAVKRESPLNLKAATRYSDGRAPSGAEYKQALEKESVRAIGSKIVGDGNSRNTMLRAGDLVQIEGVGEFNGEYGVISVRHRWSPASGYLNEFECTVWKNYTNPSPPPEAKISGVMPAVVLQHNDPRRLGRVKIRYYWMEQGETAWARMIFPHAGSGRGLVFMPEIGDEVLIAFENGDPERPYVLGCLFNGVNQQPAEGMRDQNEQQKDAAENDDLANNYVKRIFTKSGVGIQFADNPDDEMLSMIVPGGLGVYMWHKHDETERPLTYIKQEDGDIILSAPNGRIHLHSKYLSRDVGE